MVSAVSSPSRFAPRLTTPVPPELTGAEGALELLPIPAVLVECTAAGFRFEAFNTAFRVAGLGTSAERSPLIQQLGPRIARLVEQERPREEFRWELGGSVDSRHYRVTIARVYLKGEGRCLVSLLDQTSEVRTEHSLRREMTTDALTGLPNRAGFGDRVEGALRENRAGFGVMLIDLDRFSRINACLGSLAGDELLITVARRLKGALRARDMLARTGGDEFGVLLALDDGQSDAEHLAKRIRSVMSAPFRLSDYEIRVACSIGLAFAEDEGGDAEELIRHAQFAVKRSKTSGAAEAYQTQAFDRAREQFALETALRRAIEGGALRLTYQPIVDLATGRIDAFESLTRWTDEQGRAVPAADFIRVAEESGLIVPLGRWAIAQALRDLAAWDARAGGDCGARVAVNLSPIQLQRDAVAPVVEAALAETGVTGDRLKLELTESALIADPDRIARTMAALKALGTTLAMDDFGTGYSNLALLQKLPIDLLKIDRSLVTGMLADRDKVAIVRAILSLAQALGLRTVAEGVETSELGQTLTALGCTYGQGYAYAPALEADAAYALLVERNA